MISWRCCPLNPQVSKYVECYWYLEKELDDSGKDSPVLNPDPSAHLIVCLDSQTHCYRYAEVSQGGSGSHWIMPHRNAFSMDHSNAFRVLGIKFRVGSLYSLAMFDHNGELDKILTAGASQLDAFGLSNTVDLLDLAASGGAKICSVLDQSLEPWLTRSREDAHSELVREVNPMVATTKLAQISDCVHRSQRSVERSFLKVTGLTMKQCQSMLKLEEMLDYLHRLNDPQVNWADIAIQFGFSDQPHLIRYMSNIIGRTPGQYEKNRDLTIDVYGRFDLD